MVADHVLPSRSMVLSVGRTRKPELNKINELDLSATDEQAPTGSATLKTSRDSALTKQVERSAPNVP